MSISLFVTVLTLIIVNVSLAEEDKDYRISFGDVLEISVWGQDDLKRKVEVSHQGEFTFPLLGRVQAGGLTVFELEKRMRNGLADRFLVNPQVSVNVAVSTGRKVFVLGEVRRPGTYQLAGRFNLLQLLAEAGGLTDNAARTVTIVRSSSEVDGQEKGKLATVEHPNRVFTLDLRKVTADGTGGQFVLLAGDTIYVPEVQKFFVIGEVKRSGEFKWEDGITVRQALSMAGGPTEKGAPSRTEIVRSSEGSEKTLQPNMNDYVVGGDVVKVPLSYF